MSWGARTRGNPGIRGEGESLGPGPGGVISYLRPVAAEYRGGEIQIHNMRGSEEGCVALEGDVVDV